MKVIWATKMVEALPNYATKMFTFRPASIAKFPRIISPRSLLARSNLQDNLSVSTYAFWTDLSNDLVMRQQALCLREWNIDVRRLPSVGCIGELLSKTHSSLRFSLLNHRILTYYASASKQPCHPRTYMIRTTSFNSHSMTCSDTSTHPIEWASGKSCLIVPSIDQSREGLRISSNQTRFSNLPSVQNEPNETAPILQRASACPHQNNPSM